MITILNFSNVYKSQQFYKGREYAWIDFTDLSGTSGYCDAHAVEEIQKRLCTDRQSDIYFLDSGNYHYVTSFLLERVQQPFSLLLFDHHTDMQKPLLGDLLSCGSWVRQVLDRNPFLKQVILIGADNQLLLEIEEEYQERICAFGVEEIMRNMDWMSFLKENIHYPVYISVDKDVFGEKQVRTNWDQGVMTLEQFSDIYSFVEKLSSIIGMDICGECQEQKGNVQKFAEENAKNDRANERILECV